MSRKICVVDFDKTLISVDSIFFILVRERLFLQPRILFWGIALVIVKLFASFKKQFYIRRKLKFEILKTFYSIKAGRIFDIYAPLLARRINRRLADYLLDKYKRVYIISSSWRPLIEAVLKHEGINNDWIIFGTEYKEDFRKFDICWNVNKLKILRENGIKDFDLFTDSWEDLPLIERAENYFIVNKDFSWKKLK